MILSIFFYLSAGISYLEITKKIKIRTFLSCRREYKGVMAPKLKKNTPKKWFQSHPILETFCYHDAPFPYGYSGPAPIVSCYLSYTVTLLIFYGKKQKSTPINYMFL